MIVLPEHDVVNGGVARQHAGDDVSLEHVSDFGGGLQTERSQGFHLIWPPDVSHHPIASSSEVCGHRRSHTAKTDKAYFSLLQ
jgi:hypothetical protein